MEDYLLDGHYNMIWHKGSATMLHSPDGIYNSFQCVYAAPGLRVYGKPETNKADALSSLEMAMMKLRNDSAIQPLLPERSVKP